MGSVFADRMIPEAILHSLKISPQAMGGLPPKHAVQTFLGGLDCDFTGCGSGCPPGNSDLRLTS